MVIFRSKIASAVLLLAILLFLGGCKRHPGGTAAPDHRPEAVVASEALVEVKVSQFHMGMMVDLIVWAPSAKEGQQACAKAFDRIRELNLILSDYEPESELSKLCREAGRGPVKVSSALFTVLEMAKDLSKLAGGHYDITAAPVIRLWRQARRDRKLPEAEPLARAMALVSHENLVLDPQRQTAELKRAGMRIDLGSIAKGYVGDQAIATFRSLGYPAAAFIAGGDMVFGAPPPGSKGWPVQPAKTDLPQMHLSNCGFSVSGDTVQFVEINGKRYSHVIDATNGQPLTNHAMCIVIAPSGLVSDPLSTIGTILPEKNFRQTFCTRFPAVKTWVFTAE